MTEKTEFTFLRQLFDQAVMVADPMRVIPGCLPEKPAGRVVVIGAGKASARMAEAVEAAWGPCEGLVLTRYGYARPTQGIEIVEAAHPVPDAAGMAGAQRMLELVRGLGEGDFVLALISGGGSALLSAPVPPMSAEDKMALHRALLESGAPIGKMNIVRKHLSAIKGGQLAAACYPARLLGLMISDVPGDDPAAIASGATVGEVSTPANALAIIKEYRIPVPQSALAALERTSGVIAPGDKRLEKTENRVIIAPSQSLDAAEVQAKAAGIEVRRLGNDLEGEARDLGQAHAAEALSVQRTLKSGDAPVLLLSGGECTVSGWGGGVGGPNAEYVLSAAIALQGAPGIHLIACDTDGVDGAAEVAGALAGPDTLLRAQSAGLDPVDALSRNDSHSFFAGIGDQVVPGPTLTNVNDFRAILISR